MELSDLIRQQLKLPWTLYSGDVPNVVAVAGNVIVNLKCPATMELKRLQASAAAITAASQFVIVLKRNSAGTPTTLVTLTSAVPYVANVVVDSGDLSIPLFKDEPLQVIINGTDADTDDITALNLFATVQPLQESDGQ